MESIEEIVVDRQAILDQFERVVETTKQREECLKTVRATLEQGWPTEALATKRGKQGSILVLNFPSRIPIVVDYQDSVGAALFGEAVMEKLKAIMSSRAYRILGVPLSTIGGICAMLCLLPGMELLGIFSLITLPIFLCATLFLQRQMVVELCSGFDQVFLFGNLIAMCIGCCVLSEWNLIRSIVLLVFVPATGLSGAFSDALPHKMRRGAKANYIGGFVVYMFFGFGLLSGIFDLRRDVILFPNSLKVSLVQRCVAFAFNMAIFNLRYFYLFWFSKLYNFVNIRSTLVPQRVMGPSGKVHFRKSVDLVVLDEHQRDTLIQEMERICAALNGSRLANDSLGIIRSLLMMDEDGFWRGQDADRKHGGGKIVPVMNGDVDSFDGRVLKKVPASRVLIYSNQKPTLVDTGKTVGRALFGEVAMKGLVKLNKQKWFVILSLVVNIVTFFLVPLSLLPGYGKLAFPVFFGLPIYLSIYCFAQVDVLKRLLASFDQLFLYGNILGFSLALAVLFHGQTIREILFLLYFPVATFSAVYSDAFPQVMRRNGFVVYLSGVLIILGMALGMMYDIFEVPQDIILFPKSLKISLRQRCISFLFNACFYYVKYAFRLLQTPGGYVALRSSVASKKFKT